MSDFKRVRLVCYTGSGLFRNLEVTPDSRLSFHQHNLDLKKKSHQRQSVICKLKVLYVAPHLLLLLHQSII